MNLKYSNIQLFCYSIFLLLFFAMPLKAQVKIGDNSTPPKSFSVLELSTAKVKGGLRLPQLTTAQCTALSGLSDPAADGLVVYNTDIDCIEYWHAGQWVTLCNDKPDITFTDAEGKSFVFDPETPFLATGTTLTLTLHESPECTPPPNQPYSVSVKVGNGVLVTQQPDATGMFKVTVPENKSSGLRYAVISVTDNCMNESQDFIFAQASGGCQVPAMPGTITGATTNICAGGGAQSYSITQAVQGATSYTWTPPPGWDITVNPGGLSISASPTVYAQKGNISVTANNDCGSSAASTLDVTLRVDPGTSTSGDKSTCLNVSPGNITMPAATGGSGYSYKWQSSTDSISWTYISGATSANYNPPANTMTATTYFRREVTTAGTCPGTFYSAPVTITVTTVDPGTTSNPDQIICVGNVPATIIGGTATGGDGPGTYTYTWQRSEDGKNWGAVPGGTSVSGAENYIPTTAAASKLTFSGDTISKIYYFRRGIRPNTCNNANSNVFGDTVKVTAYKLKIIGSMAVQSGTTSLTYSLASVPDLNFSDCTWVVTGTGWSIQGSNTGNLITVIPGTGDGTISVSNSCSSDKMNVYIGCGVLTSSGSWLRFMCYNLGASAALLDPKTPLEQAALDPDPTKNNIDSTVYGSLYQWGRQADGHQLRNATGIIFTGGTRNISYDTNSQIPQGDIWYGIPVGVTTKIYDWHGNDSDTTKVYRNDVLWNSSSEAAPKKAGGDPCPSGWRVPTSVEWESTQSTDPSKNPNTWQWAPTVSASYKPGYLITPSGSSTPTLYLPAAGWRTSGSGDENNGIMGIANLGSLGNYWSSTPNVTAADTRYGYLLTFSTTSINTKNNLKRAASYSVRCVKE